MTQLKLAQAGHPGSQFGFSVAKINKRIMSKLTSSVMLTSSSLIASDIAAIALKWCVGHVVEVVLRDTDQKGREFAEIYFRNHGRLYG